jgi:uncharacterized Tic20 family protein
MASVAGTPEFHAKMPRRKDFLTQNYTCTPKGISVLSGQTQQRESMPDNQTPPAAQTPQPTPPTPPPGPESQAHTWNMLCHLSALAGFIIPFGNMLGPLLVWQIKKSEFPSVEIHGKAALNFQNTVILIALASMAASLVVSVVHIGWLLSPIVLLIVIADLVFAIIAGLKANNGEDYKYPYSLELVK